MRKADVIKHFGGSVQTAAVELSKLGSEIGYSVTRQGIYKWPDVVPEPAARSIHFVTKKAIALRPRDYAA